MRVPNEPVNETDGPFSELLRLQMEFYSRLAEETLTYLHRLQVAGSPAVPGTVLQPGASAELRASGSKGTTIELTLEVENCQRMHCVVTPSLSPMVAISGVTWFPAAEPVPPCTLLAPQEVAALVIKLPLPPSLPPGVYQGALLLQGFRQSAIAVTITVTNGAADQKTTILQATADITKAKPGSGKRARKARKKPAAKAQSGRGALRKRT